MLRLSSMLHGAVAALFLATAAHGDTLVLANGDRLTGEVVREHDGVIVFRSALLGELKVEATHATVAREASVGPTAAAVPSVAPVATRDVSVRHDTSAWKRQVEVGLSAQDGLRNQSTVSLRLEAARATAEGSANLLLSHYYGKTDGFVVSDATSANALLTRNLTEDLFVRGATRYDRDTVSGLEHDAEQSLGLGYTLVDRQALHLSVGAGAAVRHRDAVNEASGWDGLVDAFGRVKYALSERLSLSQDFSVTASPDDGDDYKLKSHTALINQLTEVLRMTVRYEFEYLSAAHSPVSARQRFVTAIGCVF